MTDIAIETVPSLAYSILEPEETTSTLIILEDTPSLHYMTFEATPMSLGISLVIETTPTLNYATREFTTAEQIEIPSFTYSILAPTIPTTGPYEQLGSRVRNRIGNLLETEMNWPVAWPNEHETPPTDARWAEVQINHLETELIAWGGERTDVGHTYRLHGEVVIILRTALGTGTDEILTALDTLRFFLTDGRRNEVDYAQSFVGREGQDWWAGHEQHWRVDLHYPFSQIQPIISFDDSVTEGASTIATGHGTLHDVCRDRFGTFIEDAFGLPTIYDNDPTLPPDDSIWCRHIVQSDRSEVVGIGPNADGRTTGMVTANLFAPLGAGSFDTIFMADQIALRHCNVQDQGVHFTTPSVRTIGVQRGGQWWQTVVGCPFWIREVT